MRIAIVYFSRKGNNWVDGEVKYLPVGNTELLAKEIQAHTHGDLFSLEMKEPYPEDYDACVEQARKDLLSDKTCDLISYPDLSSYDIIYLGYPIYWDDLPIAVSSYLKKQKLDQKIIHPFITHENSGLGISISHLRTLLPTCNITRPFPLPGSLVLSCKDMIERWIQGNETADLK